MSIVLNIFQVMNDKEIHAASGEIEVSDAILWLVYNFSRGHMANGMGGAVETLEMKRLIVSHSYYTGLMIKGVLETDLVKQWAHYAWRYEFTNHMRSYQSEFNELVDLVRTIAKAWGDEYPEELGKAIVPHMAGNRESIERSLGACAIRMSPPATGV